MYYIVINWQNPYEPFTIIPVSLQKFLLLAAGFIGFLARNILCIRSFGISGSGNHILPGVFTHDLLCHFYTTSTVPCVGCPYCKNCMELNYRTFLGT
jgi:hypothetical protein